MNTIICFSEKSYFKARKERKGHVFLVFPRSKLIPENETQIYVPLEPINDKKLAETYTTKVLELENETLSASLNNTYYYAASTVVAICDYIYNALKNILPTKVYLYGDPISRYVPSLYTGWGESSRNILTSSNSYYHYVSEKLSEEFNVLHCNSGLARNLIGSFSQTARLISVPAICTLYSLKKIRFNPSTPSILDDTNYFIIRNKHQFNIAQNMIDSLSLKNENVVFVELEALSSSGLQSILNESGYKTTTPLNGVFGITDVVSSLLSCYLNICKWKLKKTSRKTFSHKNLQLNIKDLAMDSFLQPQIILHKKQLIRFRSTLNRKKKNKVFSFEQISPQAYYDHKILDDYVEIYFVKSTLIQEIPMPCISWGNRFLVNDKSELRLSQCTIINPESIVYLGSPKYSSIHNLKKHHSPLLQKILFATQPHETEMNQNIIDSLIQLSHSLEFTIIIRKHPRDEGKYIVKESDILTFDNKSNIYQQLASVDLLVARTSTILEECIYIGLPYISCLNSAKDRSYSARYICKESGLVAYNTKQLVGKIKNHSEALQNFSVFRKKYLKNFERLSLK